MMLSLLLFCNAFLYIEEQVPLHPIFQNTFPVWFLETTFRMDSSGSPPKPFGILIEFVFKFGLKHLPNMSGALLTRLAGSIPRWPETGSTWAGLL